MKNRLLRAVPPSGGPVAYTSAAITALCWCLLGFGQGTAASDTASPAASRPVPLSVPIKVLRYSQHLVEQHDRNGDKKLDRDEWKNISGDSRAADRNGDGLITASEIAEQIVLYGRRRKIRLMPSLSEGRIVLPSLVNPTTGAGEAAGAGREKAAPPADTSPKSEVAAAGQANTAAPERGSRRDARFFVPPSRLPSGLPPWFRLRDMDGDAQLTLAEFAPKATQSQLAEFALYDWNGDGVITAAEAARGAKRAAKATALQGEEGTSEEAAAEPPKTERQQTPQEPKEPSQGEPSAQSTPQPATEDAPAPTGGAPVRKSRSRRLVNDAPKDAGS